MSSIRLPTPGVVYFGGNRDAGARYLVNITRHEYYGDVTKQLHQSFRPSVFRTRVSRLMLYEVYQNPATLPGHCIASHERFLSLCDTTQSQVDGRTTMRHLLRFQSTLLQWPSTSLFLQCRSLLTKALLACLPSRTLMSYLVSDVNYRTKRSWQV